MADAGYAPVGLGYFDGTPFDVAALAAHGALRNRLVEQLVDSHPAGVTIVTPPHFLVHDASSARLDVALAEETRQLSDKPIRATLVATRKYLVGAADELAREYVTAGIGALELQVTPLGGDNESVAKVRAVFAALDVFTAAGIEVVLGYSGNIGHTAVALGHAAHYSACDEDSRRILSHAGKACHKRCPSEPGDALFPPAVVTHFVVC